MKKSRTLVLVASMMALSALLYGQTEEAPSAAAAPPTAEPAPGSSFTGRIEVTAVEIMIEVSDRKGETPGDLGIEDFEVLEDGKPVTVIGVDYPRPSPKMELEELPPEEVAVSDQQMWRFLVYFDSVLTGARASRKTAMELVRRASELTEMGPVEVVVADPSPRVMVPFTRDVDRVRQAFEDLTRPRRRVSELMRIRRNFLAQRDMRIPLSQIAEASTSAQAVGQIRAALQQERALIQLQMARFQQWLDAYGNVPASAVILVNDGFDIDPSEFYLQATAAANVARDIAPELYLYRFTDANQQLARKIAARGWTGIFLAAGATTGPDVPADASLASRERYRSIAESGGAGPGAASLSTVLQRPTEPLQQIADLSGGEVLTNLKKTDQLLERLGGRLRLIYQAERRADGQPRKLKVNLKRPGLKVRAPHWTASPTASEAARSLARRMLVVGKPAGELPVEVRLEPADGAKGGVRRSKVHILFDLTDLRLVLPGPRFPIRFTIGVALEEESNFVHQVIEEVELPLHRSLAASADDSRLPRFDYTVFLDLPPKAGQVAVIVEEPSTGSWGGNISERPVVDVVAAAR